MASYFFETFADIAAAVFGRAYATFSAFVDRLFAVVLTEPLRLSPILDERPPRAIGIHEARSFKTRLMAREQRAHYLPLQASAF